MKRKNLSFYPSNRFDWTNLKNSAFEVFSAQSWRHQFYWNLLEGILSTPKLMLISGYWSGYSSWQTEPQLCLNSAHYPQTHYHFWWSNLITSFEFGWWGVFDFDFISVLASGLKGPILSLKSFRIPCYQLSDSVRSFGMKSYLGLKKSPLQCSRFRYFLFVLRVTLNLDNFLMLKNHRTYFHLSFAIVWTCS